MSEPAAIDWRPQTRRSDTLEIYLLGRVDFDSAVELQQLWAEELATRTDRLGALFLCEHPPVVVIGREGNRSQLQVDDRELRARLIELHWTNRGGGALVHAPGQLAAYPVVPLDRIGLGLADYTAALQQAMIDVCAELRVNATPHPHRPGAVCRTGQLGWIASGVRNWITQHGLFLNVAPAMHLMRLVTGTETGTETSTGIGPTSLAAQTSRPVSMHTTREHLVRHLAAQLGYDNWHIYTGHPLLGRTRKMVHVPA